MTSLLILFVVVFVLVLAAVCALVVLRLMGPAELPDSPPFPHRRSRLHHRAPGAHASGEPAASRITEPAVKP